MSHQVDSSVSPQIRLAPFGLARGCALERGKKASKIVMSCAAAEHSERFLACALQTCGSTA
jgi:hypothetical protein